MDKTLIYISLVVLIIVVIAIDYFLKRRKNKNFDNETLRKKKSWSFYKYSKGVLRINFVITTIWTIVSVFSFFNNGTGYDVFKYKVINNTAYPKNFDANRLLSINRSIELIENKRDDGFYSGSLLTKKARLLKKRKKLLAGLAFSSTLESIWDIYYVDTFFTYCFFFQILYLVAILLITPIIQKIMRWILDGFKNSKAKGILDSKN